MSGKVSKVNVSYVDFDIEHYFKGCGPKNTTIFVKKEMIVVLEFQQ